MKKTVQADTFLTLYPNFKNSAISGRFLSCNELSPQLEKLRDHFYIEEIGRSFLNVPIHSIKIGTGPVKIMGWSQMHGNESTTTKAVLDLLNLFKNHKEVNDVKEVLEKCTFLVIPMLNPDGAVRYTRTNVNKVDLNRDAQELKEVESRVLKRCYDDFQPDFCFNLHDQRTIFSAGDTDKPATISFLTPSMDPERSITESRKRSMKIIVEMNKVLQEYLPGMIGRYDDAFNINCTGDTFQSLQVPTILFEAGHFPNDYLREETRKYIGLAIFTGLHSIANGNFRFCEAADYFQIPENKKNFFDIILRNAAVKGENVDIAIQYEEKVRGNEVHFEPVVQTMAENLSYFGHKEIDCEGMEVKDISGKDINENDIVTQILLNNEKLSIISQDIP
ncbi:Zinc carboxypeptidase [Salinimicrobium catena]|uniref:Zinc carboxypeptidase n=1 Tax=Salinimicrobium catena TaxID=390640 RepID=A0A1H5LYZ6_9FLAO|nr:M14 family zinc carboxypeptidase [Salinimicrobium catena]SDL16315.1 Zinc carboxypeptidase [Salinimicrobium catena]SEE82214.1 Zinc carboxypeptidase [Salinimicrobium catena]